MFFKRKFSSYKIRYITILFSLWVYRDLTHNLPVNSLKVIGWIPRGVEQNNHIGSYKVQTKTTCPDKTKRKLSGVTWFWIYWNKSKDQHGGHEAQVDVRGAVELFDDLDSLFGFSGSVQPAVVQPLGHAVVLQHVQQLAQSTKTHSWEGLKAGYYTE